MGANTGNAGVGSYRATLKYEARYTRAPDFARVCSRDTDAAADSMQIDALPRAHHCWRFARINLIEYVIEF